MWASPALAEPLPVPKQSGQQALQEALAGRLPFGAIQPPLAEPVMARWG
jgi:hypothetical protein